MGLSNLVWKLSPSFVRAFELEPEPDPAQSCDLRGFVFGGVAPIADVFRPGTFKIEELFYDLTIRGLNKLVCLALCCAKGIIEY